MPLQFYINVLVNSIINNYFNDSYCAFVITNNENEFDFCKNIPTVSLSNNGFESDALFNHYGCQEIIIQTRRPSETFVQFENLIKHTDERFNNRKYLILPNENVEEDIDVLFQLEELNYVTNFLVVSPTQNFSENTGNETVFNLLTHKYVGNTNNNEIMVLDKWFIKNQSFLYGENLFPDKISNQEGREIKLATFTYEPYAIAESTPESSDGTEMRLALMYTQKHNLTPMMVVIENDEWGEIYDNWTGKGLLGSLAMDQGDVGFAALYTWEHEYHFLDLSKPLSRTGITCLVPTPKLSAGWLTPLFPFTVLLWIVVVMTYFFSVLSLTAISYVTNTKVFLKELNHKEVSNRKKLRKNFWGLLNQAFLRVTAIFLLQSLAIKRQVTNDKIMKYALGCILIVSLLIATSYSSGLASSMTIPRYDNPIRTTQDLANSGLPWGATSTAWITSIQFNKEKKYVTLVQNFVAATEKRLKEFAKSGKFAFSMERLPHGHYAIGNYIQRGANLIPMVEDLYWENCVIMLRKHSVLLNSLDELILRVAQSGIQAYWESEVTDKYLDGEVQKSVKYLSLHHDTRNGPVKLQWKHVEGAFGILAIGHFFALLCFLTEIVYEKYFDRIPFMV